MNKANDSGYKGPLRFYKHLRYDVYICMMGDCTPHDYYYVGECDVDVKFAEEKKNKIQAIEKSMVKEQSESNAKQEKMKQEIIELVDPIDDDCPF